MAENCNFLAQIIFSSNSLFNYTKIHKASSLTVTQTVLPECSGDYQKFNRRGRRTARTSHFHSEVKTIGCLIREKHPHLIPRSWGNFQRLIRHFAHYTRHITMVFNQDYWLNAKFSNAKRSIEANRKEKSQRTSYNPWQKVSDHTH